MTRGLSPLLLLQPMLQIASWLWVGFRRVTQSQAT